MDSVLVQWVTNCPMTVTGVGFMLLFVSFLLGQWHGMWIRKNAAVEAAHAIMDIWAGAVDGCSEDHCAKP